MSRPTASLLEWSGPRTPRRAAVRRSRHAELLILCARIGFNP